jgi:serine/threonine protein kinase
MADDPTELTRAVDRTDHASALPLGTEIGRYRVAAVLGQGAFGITYRARDLQLERDVALKEYLPALLATRLDGRTVAPRSTQVAEDFAWGRTRFLDEARTLARLGDAPAVVRVHDFLEANGTAYVVMQLVEGETLAAQCRREGRLTQAAIERMLGPLLDGLERVHAAGVLHRDIKPDNILVGRDGSATLIDFGASRMAVADRNQALTAVYTPRYAAPEQITSQQQGPYTDIYALAATLYICVTGREPIGATQRIMTSDAMASARESAAGNYSDNLLAAIDAGLLLKPDERPQTIAAWRQIFATGNQPGLAPTEKAANRGDRSSLAPTEKAAARAPGADTAKPPARTPRLGRALLLAAALLIVLGGGALWWFSHDRQTPQSFAAELEAALARSIPGAPVDLRRNETANFAKAPLNRALAIAPRAQRLRFTASWPTKEGAEEKVLEKCQQINDEPCAVIAVNDTLLPPAADGRWPVRDEPRVRYAGSFNLERIPAMRAADLQRPEIANYSAAPPPKAMALNAWGVLVAASGVADQHGAEEQALQACRMESARLKADSPCYLYAVDNRVVLPLRATIPITPVAAAPPPPPPPTTPTTTTTTTTPSPPVAPGAPLPVALQEALAKLAPSQQAAARESQVAAYLSASQHKALAAFPPSGTWRASGWASATLAEERALEGCQVRHGAPCVLVAVDDALQAADVASARRRPMLRAEYDGPFDPQQIPAVSTALRQRPDVMGYRSARPYKAAAFHVGGKLFAVSGAATQREAEERALAECDADPQRNRRDGPCFLYAVRDQVVLTRRATAPLAAP